MTEVLQVAACWWRGVGFALQMPCPIFPGADGQVLAALPPFPRKAGPSSLSASPPRLDIHLAGGSLAISLPDFSEGCSEVMLSWPVSFGRENSYPVKEYNLLQVEGD